MPEFIPLENSKLKKKKSKIMQVKMTLRKEVKCALEERKGNGSKEL